MSWSFPIAVARETAAVRRLVVRLLPGVPGSSGSLARVAGGVYTYFPGALKVKSTDASPPLTVTEPVWAGSFSCQASIS